ncbi:hypothetical protein D6817_00010 [Candidatus Pacearchaeota archaeon]|nr:MAG: hypothetical protein D6817_00010 [Candidatus Pacearchaeota archaeon]
MVLDSAIARNQSVSASLLSKASATKLGGNFRGQLRVSCGGVGAVFVKMFAFANVAAFSQDLCV